MRRAERKRAEADRIVYRGGYNACLVLAAHLYDPQRSECYPSTKGDLARNGARLWPSADRERLHATVREHAIRRQARDDACSLENERPPFAAALEVAGYDPGFGAEFLAAVEALGEPYAAAIYYDEWDAIERGTSKATTPTLADPSCKNSISDLSSGHERQRSRS
jgi:hypothetical protein